MYNENFESKDTFIPVNQPEYSKHFWNHMMGRSGHKAYLDAGRNSLGECQLPTYDADKYSHKIENRSLFRQIASYFYVPGDSATILAKFNNDSADWVASGDTIPVMDGINDFSQYALEGHKLAISMKLDADFLHDNQYIFANYLTDRLAKNFAEGEEKGCICGNGIKEPVGIINDEGGAEVGVTAQALTYDNVIDLFFSVDKDYRKNGVWIMNDHTAMALRKLKDADGNYLWNGDMDNLLGKAVHISNYMPDVEAGKKPIVFGDFSYYWFVERKPMTVMTLTEKFAEIGEVGYIATERLDGKLIRPDAVKALKITE